MFYMFMRNRPVEVNTIMEKWREVYSEGGHEGWRSILSTGIHSSEF
ncbi:uncharacterized protein PGTG_06758 [Puccinia graminis f. sp. tritici CRL 75-36-700-3]|uniref:Uncharacterized protein n=1 Tax=Puccinia graminis f. sp. tritici (strain CRL 75-36-700-3 / race SCCL) TaxID=418459 RepID=E3K8Y3_PUCGT|nr:uncharacterized protein PGTG_06758 [Puccinia graminis f. sp. tritici CRL 75-36-700-3]EFP80802.1 hypothetical protein PGTG_06758 [Puccinia graminis f. sp. tritici CRL 75-36-700-3]